MPTYDELLTPQTAVPTRVMGGASTITDAQLSQVDQIGAEPSSSLSAGFDAASRLTSTAIAGMVIADERAFEDDPDFIFPNIESPRFKAATDGLPPELWPNLSRARSDSHLQFIRENALQELAAAQELAEMGGVGTALLIGRSVVDEGAIALTAITGGVAAPFVYGAKVARLSRFARLGALTAAENVALDAVLLQSQETKDTSDLLYSAIGGFALGGAVGALTRGEQRQLGTAMAAAATANDLKFLNDAGIVSVGSPAKLKTQEYLAAAESREGPDFSQPTAIAAPVPEARSAGAAEAAPETLVRPLRDEQPPAEVLNTPRLQGVESAIRFDLAAGFGASENPWQRWLGGKLVADPVGYRGVVNEISAEETAGFLIAKAQTTFSRDANAPLSDWLSANKVPLGERTGMTARFFEAVTAAVRSQDFSDPYIGRAAQGWERSLRGVAEQAKLAKVKGFEDLDLRSGYVPRLFSQEKITKLVDEYGSGQIERVISRAISRATDIAEDHANKISRGYLHRVRKIQAGLEAAPQFALRDRDLLKQALRDAGVPDDQADEALGVIDFGTAPDAGNVSRAKRRLSLDEETVLELKGRDGVSRPVALTELFENDARLLLNTYTRQVAGQTALAKTLGVTSKADWDAIVRKSIAYAKDNLNIKQEVTDADLARLDFAYKSITGQPVEDFTSLHKAARVIRDINYIRTLNQAGFAQAADLGNVISQGGWRTVLGQIPELKGMITRIRDTGELSDSLASELEAIVPLGTQGLRHAVPSRFDTGFTDALEPALTSTFGQTVDVGLRALKKGTGYISGLTPFTIIQQRMAAKAIAQNFVNTAFQGGGKKISANRLKSMGLSDEMSERIFVQLRENSTTTRGALTGRKLKTLNFDNWDDLDARDAFSMALYRQGRRIVQENDIGSSAIFMNRELGKVLFQFRGFMLNAYSKQLLHNFKIDGMAAFAPWAYGMVFGGLAYTLRQQANTAGLADRDQILADRLSPEKIATAAFNTAGMSSLIPAGADTIWQFAGNEPVFSHARTTGLGTSLLHPSGNPTGQTLITLLNAPGTLQDGLTRREARDMLSLLPYQNALGIKNVLDALVQDLPKRNRGD